ncbi:cold shock domain-containing protein [Halorubrum ezzemoulense]|uniref:cold shock domain-containing protein n=1 Tax=Halorubrum ezzemoulense TaxID=337243 RepID=UPI00232BC936|nr:cold shock domain-containing protein [Halorubrum ezzemoulense]MDB2287008.1 cold shock domain-containing protein [Halorubrum ezzemoulense]
MALQYDGEDRIENPGESDYWVSNRFQVVLNSLSDQQVPKSLVLIGVLTEDLTPVTGDSSHHRDIARTITDPPQAEVPAETVERILWVLGEVRETIPADRKETIGRIISNSGLNSPGASSTDTTETPQSNKQNTSSDKNQSTTASPNTDKASNHQSVSGGDYECEFCAEQFHTDRNLMSHLTSCPDKPTGVQFPCGQCPKTYHSQYALDKHLNRTHEKKNTKETIHRCSDCTATFDSATALIKHRTTHSGSTSEDPTENIGQSKTGHHPNEAFVARDDIGFVTHYNAEDSYGFISTSEVPDDVFFHRTDVEGRTPVEDDYLQYDIRETDRGYKAINITHKQRTDQPDDPFASTRTRWGG